MFTCLGFQHFFMFPISSEYRIWYPCGKRFAGTLFEWVVVNAGCTTLDIGHESWLLGS